MTGICRPLVAAAGLVLALVGCGSDDGPDGATATGNTATGTTARGTIIVFAAASLSEAFTEIARAFESANPGATVTLNFGASTALAQQIISGAPADVFAAASPAAMTTVTDAGDAAAPQVFVRNTLQIAVPPGNPGEVRGLADFARSDLKIALCAEQVPCGAAAQKVFEATGITPLADTLEQDVKAALSKVQLGEVDAALVYKTDVLAAGDKVTGIAFPEAGQAVNDYPLARLTSAPNAAGGAALLAYVLSDEGLRFLAAAGFDRP